MRILVTGVAGFIGNALARKLLLEENIIIGIDDLNDYYDINLKKSRLKILQNQKNFLFSKIDLTNKNKLEKIFKKHNFKKVIHLAAQAGVRYSFIRPAKYIETNIMGFIYLLKFAKKIKVKKILYASS